MIAAVLLQNSGTRFYFATKVRYPLVLCYELPGIFFFFFGSSLDRFAIIFTLSSVNMSFFGKPLFPFVAQLSKNLFIRYCCSRYFCYTRNVDRFARILNFRHPIDRSPDILEMLISQFPWKKLGLSRFLWEDFVQILPIGIFPQVIHGNLKCSKILGVPNTG